MKLAITGHRPHKLFDDPKGKDLLLSFAIDLLPHIMEKTSTEYVGIGGALGWDAAVAQACVSLSIPFTLFLPHRCMSDRWPKDERVLHHYLKQQAQEVCYECTSPDQPPRNRFVNLLMDRNKAIMNGSTAVLAMWNGEPEGGTYNALNYARSLSPKPTMLNAWDKWQAFSLPAPPTTITYTQPYTRPRIDPVTGGYASSPLPPPSSGG